MPSPKILGRKREQMCINASIIVYVLVFIKLIFHDFQIGASIGDMLAKSKRYCPSVCLLSIANQQCVKNRRKFVPQMCNRSKFPSKIRSRLPANSNCYTSYRVPPASLKQYYTKLFDGHYSGALPLVKKYKLSICAIFSDDEAPYFKEWIEYHRLVGVEHFYLYDNSSTDRPLHELDQYIQEKLVTIIDWPDFGSPKDDALYHWVKNTQATAYRHACLKSAAHSSYWLALIDIDEFLVPIETNSLLDMLKAHSNAPGIELLWHTYGTSGISKLPKNTLLIETLHRTFLPESSLNRAYYKTILRPELYAHSPWPPHKYVFQNGKSSIRISKNRARINHYMYRTLDFFYTSKIKKSEKMQNYQFSKEQFEQALEKSDLAEDIERPIGKFVPTLRQKMGYAPL